MIQNTEVLWHLTNLFTEMYELQTVIFQLTKLACQSKHYIYISLLELDAAICHVSL